MTKYIILSLSILSIACNDANNTKSNANSTTNQDTLTQATQTESTSDTASLSMPEQKAGEITNKSFYGKDEKNKEITINFFQNGKCNMFVTSNEEPLDGTYKQEENTITVQIIGKTYTYNYKDEEILAALQNEKEAYILKKQ